MFFERPSFTHLVLVLFCITTATTQLNPGDASTESESDTPTTTMAYVRPKVLITYPVVPENVLELFEKDFDLTICEGLPEPSRDEILKKSRGMDGILVATHIKVDAEFFDAAGPQLKAISTKSAGIDYVDLAEVKKRNVLLGSTPIVLNNAVADIAVGLLVAAARRFHEGRSMIERNQWDRSSPSWLLGQDFRDSTVGIVGLGGIGQEIVHRLKGFRIGRFVYSGHTRKPEGDELGAHFVSFDELLTTSDFVVVACPLTEETRHMFDEPAFAKMKRTSVFVNIARGDIVVQDALIAALRNGTIFSAGLDVMTPEPLPVDHPLLQLDNLVVIPHLGSATARTREDMWTIAAYNVLLGVGGQPMLSPVVLK